VSREKCAKLPTRREATRNVTQARTRDARRAKDKSDEAGGQSMNLRPLEDRVIVKPAKAEEVTKSGIVLPDTAQEKPQRGTVMAVGPGKIKDDGTRAPMDVKVDDVVIYSKYGGTDVKIEGEDYKILRVDPDIYAVVEG
jgi:chaperonin GroES